MKSNPEVIVRIFRKLMVAENKLNRQMMDDVQIESANRSGWQALCAAHFVH